MGLVSGWIPWSREAIDPAQIDTLTQELHDRLQDMQSIRHWSVIEWYKPLDEDGYVGQAVYLDTPLLVEPFQDGYRLLHKCGAVAEELPRKAVAEFEDTLFCARFLAPEWHAALEAIRR